VERREGNEVGFIVFLQCKDGTAKLLDIDTAGEGGFLGVVAVEADAMLFVGNAVRCDRRVVAIEE